MSGMPSEADPAGDDGSVVRAQPAAQADLAGRDALGAEPSERVSLDGGDTLTVPDVHHGRLPGDELSYQAAIVAAAGDPELDGQAAGPERQLPPLRRAPDDRAFGPSSSEASGISSAGLAARRPFSPVRDIRAAIRPATTGVVTAAGWSFIALGA
jgi:hypothetical protein